MIIVRLQGGLGNQMFQYAIGRQLAINNSTKLWLDLTLLKNSNNLPGTTPRSFELDEFNISADKLEILEKRISYRLTSRFFHPKRVFENSLEFDPSIIGLKGNLILEGYWQSPYYFENIAETIRNEFTQKSPTTVEIGQLITKIKSSESVSIHIRRGDFVTNANAHSFHGVSPITYYQKAIDVARQQLTQPHFYLFSDDLDWVKTHFNFLKHYTIVDQTTEMRACEDLRLMSYCKHHIIANSSFSWWGAWLNDNAKKLVIAPDRWFASDEMNMRSTTLLPRRWLRM